MEIKKCNENLIQINSLNFVFFLHLGKGRRREGEGEREC